MKKLTITMDEDVYAGLHQVIGRRRISGFIQQLVRPHVLRPELDAAYREMAADRVREVAAEPWVNGLAGDVGDDAW
jgi:hypothetical protein